jgi:hypothetical protein
MARRDVPEFVGTPTLTDAKVSAFKRQLAVSMGDEDKAGDVDDAAFYEGWSMALDWVLTTLYDHPGHTECADGCGLDVDHGGACLDRPGGRQVCSHD